MDSVPSRQVPSPRETHGQVLYLLLHGFGIPQQQLARDLVHALAADVWSREVHLGSEAWGCGRTHERGPIGAAGERQDSAKHMSPGSDITHHKGRVTLTANSNIGHGDSTPAHLGISSLMFISQRFFLASVS